MDYILQHDDSDLIDEESSDPARLTRDILAEFDLSTSRSSLDSSVAFHRDALRLLPVPHTDCLQSLALALVLRFRRTKQMEDLDEALSLLVGLASADRPLPGVLASASAAFLMKYIVTGAEKHREESLAYHYLLKVCSGESRVCISLIKFPLDNGRARW